MNPITGGSAGAVAALCLLTAFGCAGPPEGPRETKPNIVLYVIDGAAAERMSVYGYGRATTPCLERLAAEGTLFVRAHSNSSFTKTSVPSFMTSLQSGVLGGYRSATDALPAGTETMAERLRRAGYTTEVLTSNPYCGRISGLDRGVDIMRDTEASSPRPSSAELEKAFWRSREARPAEPFWVHFQSTDVHRPWAAAGFRASLRPDARSVLGAGETVEGPPASPDQARLFERAGDLYDECMAVQDRSIGRLVERLKRDGTWGRTLFIVAADHASFAAGLPLADLRAPRWAAPLLASHKSRIPLIFVWPGRIPAGRRIGEPVSMIDLLPTVLDLAGLPAPPAAQGRSLAPLLLGKRGWKPRPVVLDESYADGRYRWGSLEIVDGRWGASLRFDTRPAGRRPPREGLRPAPLLVFDLEKDPHAFKSLHAERPDLLVKYAKMLERQWNENRTLARRFTRPGGAEMTLREAERLRTLGYIR